MLEKYRRDHGKSRTLTNFSAWILGKKHSNKIITASFNDDLAQDFSRFTRDIIAEEKNVQEQFVFSDIFDAKIKKGDAALNKWALDGQFFNYKGAVWVYKGRAGSNNRDKGDVHMLA